MFWIRALCVFSVPQQLVKYTSEGLVLEGCADLKAGKVLV